MYYITVDCYEVGIFKAVELFTTYIILYFIHIAMKIACGFKHTNNIHYYYCTNMIIIVKLAYRYVSKTA